MYCVYTVYCVFDHVYVSNDSCWAAIVGLMNHLRWECCKTGNVHDQVHASWPGDDTMDNCTDEAIRDDSASCTKTLPANTPDDDDDRTSGATCLDSTLAAAAAVLERDDFLADLLPSSGLVDDDPTSMFSTQLPHSP